MYDDVGVIRVTVVAVVAACVVVRVILVCVYIVVIVVVHIGYNDAIPYAGISCYFVVVDVADTVVVIAAVVIRCIGSAYAVLSGWVCVLLLHVLVIVLVVLMFVPRLL